jgi:hypothetical protein
MANMMKDGLAWATQQFRDHASELVTLRRGDVSTPDVHAMIGRKMLRIDDGSGGIRVEYTDLDACIPAVEYDFGDGPVTPERGDLILVMMPYDVQTFEVLPFGTEPPWRWADPIGQTMVRVHAKHIDTEQFYA